MESLDSPVAQLFAQQLFEILDETFASVHGIFLDRNTSLFETLAGISARTASLPVSEDCASIAGQVEHVRFYLEVLQRYLLKQEVGKIDWQASWWLHEVTPDEWDALRRRLADTYEEVRQTLQGIETWDDADQLGGALAVLAHTAYHLGEIRQALCTLRNRS